MNKSHFIIMGFLLLLYSCKSKTETVSPVEEKITESVYAAGVVISKNQYQVFSSMNGIVTNLYLQEGDTVKKGDEILSLKNTTAQLNAENADLAAYYAAATSNTEKLKDIQNTIKLAKTKMENDASLLKRQQNLWKQEIGTKNELDRIELAYKNSTTAYEAANLKYTDLQKQISFQEKQAQKNVSIAKNIAADYTIKSAVDGRIYNMLVKKGEMVSVQMPVAVVGDASDFMLELQIDEYDIASIKIGQKILVSMDSYKGEIFEAEVSRINPLMNERSKSFTIEAVFITQPAALFPNLTCEANVVIESKEKALTIPRSYLLEGDQVLLANDEKRKVTTGLKDYEKVEIIKGISVADRIKKPKE